MRMLKDCQAGTPFKGVVLVTEWKEMPFRQKPGTFISLTCQDASGVLPAKIWESDARMIEWLKEKDLFLISASATEFRGSLELAIDSICPLDEEEVDLSLLFPCSPVSAEELERRLQALRQQIADQNLRSLLARILDHPQTGSAFRKAPAAAKMHQAYLRGLWEHSVSVAELAQSMQTMYPEIRLDLLLTGALLHDIGKIFEYRFDRGISYTTDGRLLGHIVMGLDLVSREIDKIPGFPADMKSKLLHMITSHHGRYEWQSPKRPKCMEAVMIHYADTMEADLWQFRQAKQNNPGEEWSPYVRSLERYLYLD